jgi:hypothetical protein
VNLKILSFKCSFEQRVQRNPNLNSAESSLLTFFQESLKRFLANIARKSKKDKKAKEK